MANKHCPHKKEAPKKQDGEMVCSKLGRSVKITKGRCSEESCSCSR